MDNTGEDITAAFRIRELSRDGRRVRVFADNYPYLAGIFECLETHAERELVVQDDVRLTFARCRAQAARLAHHLSNERGMKPGDRIGLALPNSPEWMVGFIAISAIGAVPALINARAGKAEFDHCLASTGCRLCLRERHDAESGVDAMSMDELRVVVSGAADHALPATPRKPDDEALLMFTSGTTGLPKGASMTHQAVLTALKTIQYSGVLVARGIAEAAGIDLAVLMRMRPPPVNLLVFPLFHVSGCHAVFLTSLMQGGKIVLMTRWDAGRALELIERERVTAFPAVPTMYRDLLRLETRNDHDLSSLTSLSVGGQATPPALLADIHGAFPSSIMGTGYGMTEANGTVTLMVGAEFIENARSVGRPVSTVDIEIRDDAGRALPANATGEIHIRGAALMTGYANAEEPTFDQDGWFATGDVGYFDDDGLLYIVDRKTDMVISGGENIYCAEVERVIELHPDVRETAAFGLPDERLGEKLVAAAVPHPDRELTEAALLNHCLAHLARHKVPKRVYIDHAPLPRNASGKAVKARIRQHYLESTENGMIERSDATGTEPLE